MMFGRFGRTVALAAACTVALSSTAMAANVYYIDSNGQVSETPNTDASVSAEPAESQSNYTVVGRDSSVSSTTIYNDGSSSGTDSTGTSSSGQVSVAPGGSAQSTAQNLVQSTGVSYEDGVPVADPYTSGTPAVHIQYLDTTGQLTGGHITGTGEFASTTDGFSGLKIRYEYAIGDVFYRVHTDEHGWTQWAMNEMITPYSGDGAKVTAVEIRTKGHTRNMYDLYYRATLNDGTVLDWAHDGQASGTFATGKYIQSMDFVLWKKNVAFFQSTSNYQQAANYEGVYTGSDGQLHYSTYNGQPYTGWAYDTDNNKYYFSEGNIVTGWQYIDGYKYYFDASGKVVTDLEPIIGLTGDYILKLNKSMKTLTVYTRDGDNGYILPVKVILTTIGPDTPIGTFTTYASYRWKFMHDDIYCQYLLRFKNGFLLHSIIYQGAPDSYHLTASTYNQLGKNSSDGCVRMRSGDAAWVYTNCGVGTQLTIYTDEWVMGPFDRPAIEQAIPDTQNYDPTDPVVLKEQQAEAQAAAEAAAAAAVNEATTGVEAAPQEVAE